MTQFNDKNVSFWIKNNLNVLLRGKHGVGKTAKVLDAFKNAGLRCQYFSAATIDPWTDFVGIPKEKVNPDGTSHLELIRPSVWANDEVDVIFLDELNRAHKKVRNACMELIQFKSINGKKFNNLKMVWAAINPEDDDKNKYDVEALDPAQMDRFQVIVNVPYAPEASFFRKKYGKEVADKAITWWKNSLSDAQKDLVSPRRLDYLLDIYVKGGDLRCVADKSVNVGQLVQEIVEISVEEKLNDLKTKPVAEIVEAFNSDNLFNSAKKLIPKKAEYVSAFLPVLSQERQTILMCNEKTVADYVFSNYAQFKLLIDNIAESGVSDLSKRAKTTVEENKTSTNSISKSDMELFNSYYQASSWRPAHFKAKHPVYLSSATLSQKYEFYKDNIGLTETQKELELILAELAPLMYSGADVESFYPKLPAMMCYMLTNLSEAAINSDKSIIKAKDIASRIKELIKDFSPKFSPKL